MRVDGTHLVTRGWRGVLLGILGGAVPPGSQILDQKMSFSTPVFRPGGGHKTQHYMFTGAHGLLMLTKTTNYVIIAEIKTATKRFLKFFLIHLELKRRTH